MSESNYPAGEERLREMGRKLGFVCGAIFTRADRTEDAGYRRDPERNTSPHLVIMSVVVVPLRGPSRYSLVELYRFKFLN